MGPMTRIPDPPDVFPTYDDGEPLACSWPTGTNATGPRWCCTPSVAWRWAAAKEWLPVCRKHARGGRVAWPTPAQCKAAGQPYRRPTPKPKAPSRTQLRAKCDRLFAEHIRSHGECEVVGSPKGLVPGNCSERLQCAHIISRKEFGTRWDVSNAVCLCSAHHTYFTNHQLRWEVFIDHLLGRDFYVALREKALAYDGPPDYAQVLADLEALTKGLVSA